MTPVHLITVQGDAVVPNSSSTRLINAFNAVELTTPGANDVSANGATRICFIQGSYWWIRTQAIRRLDWPDKRLRHNGGDTALSEAVWQARLPQHGYTYGVEIDCFPRRGRSEVPAGFKSKIKNHSDNSKPRMLGRMDIYRSRLLKRQYGSATLDEHTLLLGDRASPQKPKKPRRKAKPVYTAKKSAAKST